MARPIVATVADDFVRLSSSVVMSSVVDGLVLHVWIAAVLLMTLVPTMGVDAAATGQAATATWRTSLRPTIGLTSDAMTSPTTHSRPVCLSAWLSNTTNSRARRCLRKRTRLARRYYKHLSNPRRRAYNICKEIKKRHDCLPRASEMCPTLNGELRHWQNLIDFMKCDCNKETGKCENDRRCFENAFHSPLGRACADMYEFNIRQNTQDKCFFQAERLRCKQAVLDSACDHQAALASFHVIILARPSGDARKCRLNSETPHDRGLRYSVDCPPDFAEPIELCNSRHLTRHHLLFYDTLELVAVGNKTNVQRACAGYDEYKRCTSGVHETCTDQAQVVYNADNNLRTYTAKMEYLCGDGRSVYMDNLHCFIGVVRNVSILPCQLAWSEAQNVLHTITAHEYFCLPDSNSSASRTVRSHLDKVRECYVNAFGSSCGEETRHVMSKSLDLAFSDPYYLHMEGRPDCDLHAGRVTGRIRSNSVTPEVTWCRVTVLFLGALLTLSISRGA